MIALLVIAVYLLAGLLFLMIFDLLTGRIRRKFKDAVADTQLNVANTSPVMGHDMAMIIGRKTAFVIMVLATWAFWIAVLIGFISDSRKQEKK